MTTALPEPATSTLTSGVSHPHPVNGGRSYLPATRPPRSRSKPGWERSGTTACLAVRQEQPPISVRPAVRTAVRTAPTVTVADSRPSLSIPPVTGEPASIWTSAVNRLTPSTFRLALAWLSARSPVN
jgi:hypothetical protein